MTDATHTNPDLIERLQQLGDPGNRQDWIAGDHDYVTELGLNSSDVPVLMDVMQSWFCEPGEGPVDIPDEAPAVYAPIHAWRALGQMRAADAEPAMLGMLDRLEEMLDDWAFEEFPFVWAMIGESAIDPLAAYLADASHREYSRVCVAHGLCEVGQRDQVLRGAAVLRLTEALNRQETDVESLNGFLVSYLLDLKAVESAEAIERAYAADCVDLTITGNWAKARAKLGVEGLGLISEEQANRKPPPLLGIRRSASLPGDLPVQPGRKGDRKHRRKQRKKERRNRRRGRRK
jgi:hypothetical protein